MCFGHFLKVSGKKIKELGLHFQKECPSSTKAEAEQGRLCMKKGKVCMRKIDYSTGNIYFILKIKMSF